MTTPKHTITLLDEVTGQPSASIEVPAYVTPSARPRWSLRHPELSKFLVEWLSLSIAILAVVIPLKLLGVIQ